MAITIKGRKEAYELAYAAGTDEGNRHMRKDGRKVWSQEDRSIAARETNRILDELRYW